MSTTTRIRGGRPAAPPPTPTQRTEAELAAAREDLQGLTGYERLLGLRRLVQATRAHEMARACEQAALRARFWA